MATMVRKEMKMPKWLSDQIEKFAKSEGAGFSQFMRTAAVERIRRMKKVA